MNGRSIPLLGTIILLLALAHACSPEAGTPEAPRTGVAEQPRTDAEPLAAPPGFRIKLTTWKASTTVDDKGHLRKWWLQRKPGEMSQASPSFDSHTANGTLADDQRGRVREWIKKRGSIVFGLQRDYAVEGARYIATISLTVGERSTSTRYAPGKLPADAQAAIADLESILKEVTVTLEQQYPRERTIDPGAFRR